MTALPPPWVRGYRPTVEDINSALANTADLSAALAAGDAATLASSKAYTDSIALPIVARVLAPIGTTDWSDVVQAAVNTGLPVQLPMGIIRLTRAIRVTTKGQRIFGYGRAATMIQIGVDFDMGATGVFVCTGGEPGPEFESFTVNFAQNDASTQSGLIQYPPAFYLVDTPRSCFTNVRIFAGVRGIVFAGNCGGATIKDIATSCLITNIEIDGSYDTMSITGWHVFPTGLTSAQQVIFYSNTCIGLKTGRCDDLKLIGSLFLIGRAIYSYGSTIYNGGTTGSVTACSFDTYGDVLVTAGWLEITGCYFTLVNGVCSLTQQGTCTLDLSGNRFEIAGGTPSSGYVVSAGGAAAEPCIFNASGNTFDTGSADVPALVLVGSVLLADVNDNVFRRSQSGVFANASVYVSGGSNGIISDNAFSAPGSGGSGPCIGFALDVPYTVTGNYCGTRAILTPGQINTLFLKDNFSVGGNDLVANNLVGSARVNSYHGTTDGSGNIALAHNVANLQQRVLDVSVLQKNSSGAAVLAAGVTTYIDGGAINVNGAVPNLRIRATVTYTDYRDVW